NSGWRFGSQFLTESATSGMSGGFECAIYLIAIDLACACFVSPHARKLSDYPASLAGCALFLDRLDHGHEIVSVICCALQALRRNLSRTRIDHHFADLDVSHLFVPAIRRHTERDPSPRTRKARQIRSA